MIKVLFVCMGNICRSPTAEAVFRQRAERSGLGAELEVRSAGTHGYHEGNGADPRAEAAAAARGYDLGAHCARRVRPGDFHEFDYIVAMDRDNLEMLDAMAPDGARSDLSLFLSYLDGSRGAEVPDPYYGGGAGFDEVLDLAEEASDAFLEVLRRDLSGAGRQRVIDAATADLVERAIGKRPHRSVSLSGGCVADVRRVSFAEGEDLVAKIARAGGLEIEGWMLLRLAAESSLPVPAVVHAEDRLLLLEYVDADGGPIGPAVERHAAELLASLHDVSTDDFGLDRDTVIGTLDQPNPPAREWIPFFRDHRLLEMARRAASSGALAAETMLRIERLAERLDEWIVEPSEPSLIHGDVWSGNVLVRGEAVAAFIDPAIYYADPEIELAFTTLFSTFGASFFDRYSEIRPVSAEFFEYRRDLYNLYPLLVHAVLFGGHYGGAVDRTVRRFVG